MAAANVLTVGTTAANSADVAVTTPLTVCLKDAAGPGVPMGAFVKILLKDDAGQYFQVDTLDYRKPAVLIEAPGTYRFTRPAGGPAVGVFSG